MKRGIILFILLGIFFLNLASAVEIQLSKESYAPGETLQAEIFGNFISGLDLENIYFYRDRNIPVLYDLLKTKDKYLLYAVLPYKEGNYTLKIKNTVYTTATGESSEALIKEFEIKAGNESVLTINPGFVVATEDFDIKVKSNENKEITAEFEATGEKQSVSLIQNTEKKIHFSISGITNYTESNIKIEYYVLPVFIFPEKSPAEIIKQADSFRFNPQEIKATILKEQGVVFNISLINLGDAEIKNIKFSSEIALEKEKDKEKIKLAFSPEEIQELKAGEEGFIGLTISSESDKNFSGKISATAEQDIKAELNFYIDITDSQAEVKYESPGYAESANCDEIGKICAADEICDVDVKFTLQGSCCSGNCKKESDGNSWFWGIIILIVVFLALGLLYFLMKKRQKKPEDFLRRREKNFEERMHPEGEEVRKSLTRI